MRRLYVLAIAVLAVSSTAFGRGHGGGHHSGGSGGHHSGGSHAGHVSVPSYTKKNGAHVGIHERSGPNSIKSDNWSTKGNVNPHTGKAGTKEL